MARITSPSALGLAGPAATRYKRWRARNPVEAKRYDQLTTAGKRNIATIWATPLPGRPIATQAVQLAHGYRRERINQRAAANRWLKEYVGMSPMNRRRPENRPENRGLTDAQILTMFWRRYDSGIDQR